MGQMKLVAAVCGCLLLTACGGSESEARKAVLANLKDPDSAKFGKFTQMNEKSACLTVNARNSLGGYTGDQQASLIKFSDSKGWEVIGINKYSHDTCINITTEVSESSQHKP